MRIAIENCVKANITNGNNVRLLIENGYSRNRKITGKKVDKIAKHRNREIESQLIAQPQKPVHEIQKFNIIT